MVCFFEKINLGVTYALAPRIADYQNQPHWIKYDYISIRYKHHLAICDISPAKYFVIFHYNDVITGAIASQITSLEIVYSTVYPGVDQSKPQSSASLAFVRGIHRGPVNSPHKWPVTRKISPFDDVIMSIQLLHCTYKYVCHSCVWIDWLTDKTICSMCSYI